MALTYKTGLALKSCASPVSAVSTASLHIHGWDNIAAGLRWAARDYAHAATRLGLAI